MCTYRAVIVAVVFMTAACSCQTYSNSDQVINVYVASSLTDLFTTFETQFEADHPTVDVQLNIAGSSTLARQINEGASVDVFAPADTTIFDSLETQPSTPPTLYGRNTLALLASNQSKPTVKTVDDLTKAGVIARCFSGVPCGNATEQYLDDTNVKLRKTSDEPNVRLVLRKVEAGEVAAGFVYTTDALRASDKTTLIQLENPPTVTLGIVSMSKNVHSQTFVDYVASTKAQQLIEAEGFLQP